jgi:redox-sensitive bicupin YhaK (pirin superfamily)
MSPRKEFSIVQDFDRGSRGTTQISWLESHHTFSFGEFHDPNRMGFRSLRVINEDHVIAGGGFAQHGHRDMEILTYVISGALGHKDSLGNGSIIRPGEIQRMSAGTGIRHSEMNASNDEPVHFLQIWVEPNAPGHAPSYEQIELAKNAGQLGFTPIATSAGGGGAISLHQDVILSVSKPSVGEAIEVAVDANRYGFLHFVKGALDIGGKTYRAGDGFAFEGLDGSFVMTAQEASEILFFNLV